MNTVLKVQFFMKIDGSENERFITKPITYKQGTSTQLKICYFKIFQEAQKVYKKYYFHWFCSIQVERIIKKQKMFITRRYSKNSIIKKNVIFIYFFRFNNTNVCILQV